MKGPSGTYSHFWISLADQSFMRQNPKTRFLASWVVTRWPISVGGPPMKNAISNSKSNSLLSPNTGWSQSFGSVCPKGRVIGWPVNYIDLRHSREMLCILVVNLSPETITELARPWYPTGKCFQFGIKALSFPRNMIPTFVAWWIDE